MTELFKYSVFGLYALMIITMIWVAVFGLVKRERNIKKMQTDLKLKISNGLHLSNRDVVILGRAHGLSPSNSRLALYRVYKDIDNSESFENLKRLVHEIEKEEPFDIMPDEVKPSLLRISEISANTESVSDRHILNPITNVLAKYQELVEEQKKSKRQTYIAYLVSIVSFAVGTVSLYFAIKAPSAMEIAKQLNEISMN